MKKFKFNWRGQAYNQADAFEAVPVLRKPVVPGESMDISGSVKLQTAAFSQNVITGGLASVFLFYVPNRLVWDDWTGFISQEEGFAGTFPVSTTFFDECFEHGTASKSMLYRRAFKLCYNQFFGSDKFDDSGWAYYDDITADGTDNVLKRVRNMEQWSTKLMMDGALAEPTYAASPIVLNDFYREMMNARSRRKANMTGDKYVDALRRCGVDPDWRIQMAPEFLGRFDKEVMPVKTFDTTSANIGDSVSRYETTIDVNCKRKMFAEHGYIVGIFVLRPHLFNQNMNFPPDALSVALDDFYLGDNERSQDEINQSQVSSGVAQDMFISRLAHLRDGYNFRGKGTGAGSPWCLLNTPAVGEEVVYPWGSGLPVGDELSGDGLAVNGNWTVKGVTPIPPNAL